MVIIFHVPTPASTGAGMFSSNPASFCHPGTFSYKPSCLEMMSSMISDVPAKMV
jgi:hypothetical protein